MSLPTPSHWEFPPAESALKKPNGFLAAGGDLLPATLLQAYRLGIFPWYSDPQPILWWSPDPRTVFRTDNVHLSARFRRWLRRCGWVVRADTAFDEVISTCASIPRRHESGTWITREMVEAYRALHRLGHAHAIEVYAEERLVGGLYGVSVGRMFFGESMFSVESGGSKVALAAAAHRLYAWGFPLIDAQVENDHLLSLGAERWPRERFLTEVASLTASVAPTGPWTQRFGTLAAAELAAGAPGLNP